MGKPERCPCCGYVEPAPKPCAVCEGTGRIDDDDPSRETCPECDGSGIDPRSEYRGPKALNWFGLHDRLPALYECVIVCYIGPGTDGWNVGAGHRHEQGWTVETDNAEDVGPFAVCAWMDWPERPTVALRGAVQHYEDATWPMRGGQGTERA